MSNNFIKDWFNNPKYWFSKTNILDKYITNNYEYLLDLKPDNCFAYIILYDQLPRHIFRNCLCNHIIEYFNILSIKLINKNLNLLNILKYEKLCFYLLPLRHTNNINLIKFCIKTIIEKKENHSTYKNFLKASYKQLISLNTNQWIKDVSNYKILKPNYNILKFNPNSNYFLNKNNMIGNLNLIDPTKLIIISLSGGVDSMVCSYILKNKFYNNNIIAVHVNYNNRQSCDDEVKILIEWCKFLNIKLYVRTLDEINRDYSMENEFRDLYEEYTRIMRFNLYKFFGNQAQIIIGHNKCDCLENIITNICNKNKYNNLYGMDYYSNLDNINFYRPLLNINKDEIIKFAINNNIPFLPTSTPEWSQRGQIRNSVEPVLNKWNINFIPGLFELSKNVKDLYKELEKNTIQFNNKIKNNESINIDEINLSKIFWKNLFEINKIYLSNKSLENLIKLLEKNILSKQKRIIKLNSKYNLQLLQIDKKIFKISILFN